MLKKVIIAVLAAVMIVSGFFAARKEIMSRREQRKFDEIAERAAESAPTDEAGAWTESAKAQDEEEKEPEYEPPEFLVELHAKYPDCVAYIDIKDTPIQYPVMWNEDNEYYLYRDMDGNRSGSGCVYLDANHSFKEKGLHTLYGHHMKNGSMFAGLSKFKDPKYLAAHQDITVTSLDREVSLRPIYCYNGESDGTYRNTLSSRGQVVSFIKEKTGLEVDADELYVFVTCDYAGSNWRCYLLAVPD